MTPNPILKVLSTLRSHRVQFLLTGGQACILYGALEFSRKANREYWRPLIAELEMLRHKKSKNKSSENV